MDGAASARARSACSNFVVSSLAKMPRRARTSPRRAPRQKRAEDTVSVLLRATELTVERHGFHGATTNRIAEAAGVSIGTLYHYFPTKEALVEAVVHRMWAEEMAVFEQHGGRLVDAPLDAAIGAIVTGLVGVVAKRRELYKRWYAEASHLGQLGVGLAMSDRAIDHVRAALERRRAEVRPTDVAFAADLVVKTALAVVRTGARDYPAQIDSGDLAAALADMLARYLVKDPR